MRRGGGRDEPWLPAKTKKLCFGFLRECVLYSVCVCALLHICISVYVIVCACVNLAIPKPVPDVLGASLLCNPGWNVLELACCHWAGWADNALKHYVQRESCVWVCVLSLICVIGYFRQTSLGHVSLSGVCRAVQRLYVCLTVCLPAAMFDWQAACFL